MPSESLLQRLLAEDSFENETFRDLDLEAAQLGGKELYRCTFENCRLQESRWKSRTPLLRCTAQEANFLDSDLSESDFAGTDLSGAVFRGCALTATDFSVSTGLFLEPARNRLEDTRVVVEAAVLLAHSQGMLVAGYAPEPKRTGKRGRS